MTNVILFPMQRVQSIRMTPVVVYSIAEFDDLPDLEYENFAFWNEVYLNDRDSMQSHAIPATMLGKSRSFFSQVMSFIGTQALDSSEFDPSRAIYSGLFELLASRSYFTQYSILNNSLGSFSRGSSKVHLDFVCCVQIQRAHLRIGFRTIVTKSSTKTDAEQSLLLEQEA